MELLARDLTGRILQSAFRVHSELGPGLLESAYRTCLVHELQASSIEAATEVPIPVRYRGIELDCGYRADLVVEKEVLIELKSVDRLHPLHSAQLLTYLKLSGLRVGLLFNFNTTFLQNGFRRLVL